MTVNYGTVYPTVHNDVDRYGLAIYEIFDGTFYPTVHNTRDIYGLPAFELHRGRLHPTLNNTVFAYTVPAYELIGQRLYPTGHYDNQEPFGVPLYEIRVRQTPFPCC